MIVRDEEATLPACIESVRGLAGEMIVVDTGSRDATVRIARALGAEVYTFEWIDDFSAARNESIRHATGEWILCLDADERLRPHEHEKVRRLLRNGRYDAYLTPILNECRTGAQAAQRSYGHRLFRGVPGVRFEGTIHEQVAPSFARLGLRVGTADFTIEHQGYAADAATMQRRMARNLALLRRQAAADPSSAYTRYNLGQALLLGGRIQEAEGELKCALRLSGSGAAALPIDIVASLHNNLAECRMKAGDAAGALPFVQRSLELAPAQVIGHVFAYRIHTALGRYELALQSLARARDVSQSRSVRPEAGLAIEAEIPPARFERALGMALARLGRTRDAARHFEAALRADASDVPSRVGLAKCRASEERYEDARVLLDEAGRTRDLSQEALHLSALVHVRTAEYAKALSDMSRLARVRPRDKVLARRMAAVCMKMGRRDEARRHLCNAECRVMNDESNGQRM